MGLVVGELAVRHRAAIWRRTREVAQRNLHAVDGLLADHPGVIEWVRPEGGMTGFPWLTPGIDTRPFCEEAARRGVLGTVAIVVATVPSEATIAAQRLRDFLKKH